MILLDSNNNSSHVNYHRIVANKLLGLLLLVSSLFGNAVSAQVTADFSVSSSGGCPPINVTVTNLSTGSPTSYLWNFGNGSPTTTSPNPSGAIYISAGTYTITLTASKPGDTSTQTKTITVYNPPAAEFIMSTDTSCIGRTITFTDATVISAGGTPIGTRLWDFGDGHATTVAVPTITHTYSLTGTYPVNFVVVDAKNCNGNAMHNVVILPPPTASFSATPTSACVPPLSVAFTSTSSSIGNTTYSWDFGDGTTSTAANPAHTYTATGTYSVTLIVNQNGCIASHTKLNYITIQNITADFSSPTVACTGQAVTFSNTSTPSGTTSKWDFGDANTSTATSPSHSYATPGTYTITLISSKGNCTDTTFRTITVNQTPTARFTADTTVACSAPFTVYFTDTSTGGTNYNWTFGDGSPQSTVQNPSHTYTTTGLFTVTLRVWDSITLCSNTIVKNSYIQINPPVANFTSSPSSGCSALTVLAVQFTSTSTSSVDPVTSYIWNFGEGNNDTTTQVTSHTYTVAGSYTVTLTIETAHGCISKKICNNCINVGAVLPIAGFKIVNDTVCYGSSVSFLDTSLNATTWDWNFGDGSRSFTQNTSHVYADTGTYSVFLITSNGNCKDTSIMENVVVLPPEALFSVTLNCANYDTVNFTSTSIGADSLVWDFGDGSQDFSNTSNPIHSYGARGTFTVKLTAYNYATKCSNYITHSFTIAEPIANFTTANKLGCHPFTASFNSTSSQDINTVLWNFGDPSSASNTSGVYNPTHIYNTPGQYFIKLIITDVNGCKDTSTYDTLRVLGPRPYFFADNLKGCAPLTATFTDTSHADSTLVRWIWNFGDGSPNDTTRNTSITHTYTNPYSNASSYVVTMTVLDSTGCTATIVKNSYIRPTFPVPFFKVDSFACKGNAYNFDASQTNAVSPTYSWDFGDGTKDTIISTSTIKHFYTYDSLYTITLTVTDINGCTDSITHKVRMLNPTANFGFSLDTLYCGTMEIAFHDSSTGYPTKWEWDFGNGGTSTLQNPLALYQDGGFYNVQLIVTSAGGCKDTIRKDSLIGVPFPFGTFTFTPSAGCNPVKICLDVTNINTQYNIWDFGDGNVVKTMGDTCYYYTQSGTFTPICISADTLPNGKVCYYTDDNLTGSLTITNATGITINGPKAVCPGDSVTLTATGGSIFSWNTGASTNSIIASPTTTTAYTVTITNGTCIHDTSITVMMNPSPVVNITGNDICEGSSVMLTASGGTSYTWNTTPVQTTSSIIVTPASITTYSVNVFNGNCYNDTSITINVNPIPTVTVGADVIINYGTSTVLNSNDDSTGTYLWSPSTGLSCVSCQTPTASPSITTTYAVSFTDSNQCSNTAFVTVIVEGTDCAIAGELYLPNAFTPNGDGENDVLEVYYGNFLCIQSLHIIIYDRWGERVFRSYSPYFQWDGIYRGDRLNSSVFAYYLHVEFKDGTSVTRNGNISLIR